MAKKEMIATIAQKAKVSKGDAAVTLMYFF